MERHWNPYVPFNSKWAMLNNLHPPTIMESSISTPYIANYALQQHRTMLWNIDDCPHCQCCQHHIILPCILRSHSAAYHNMLNYSWTMESCLTLLHCLPYSWMEHIDKWLTWFKGDFNCSLLLSSSYGCKYNPCQSALTQGVYFIYFFQ